MKLPFDGAISAYFKDEAPEHIRAAIQDGKKGDMQNAVNVFRRTTSPCYTCGTPIERIKLVQRSTHFCPTCQS